MNAAQFQDRFDAGRFLAGRLEHFRDEPNVVVLALPRGGVPVAYEIARALNLPLDIFVVRKLGVPGYEELAMGAIASGGVRVLNEELIHHVPVQSEMLDAVTAQERIELERREREYRDGREPLEISGRCVILVDDGLATGASMRAAVRALRLRNPASIVVAVPVAARDTCAQFRGEVDEIICGRTPEPFRAVGLWYADFGQLADEDVSALLNRAAHEHRARRVREERLNTSRPGGGERAHATR